jgi:hypothetical protein
MKAMKPRSMYLIFALILLVLFTSGCYWNDDVRTDQVGVQLNRNKIISIVGPGVYTDMGWFSDLREVSVGTLTFSVEDPEVATSDNQLVGVKITIQARRKSSDADVRNLVTNWPALVDDGALITTVSATAREGIKVGTRTFNIEGLLNDRNGLATRIREQLEADAEKYSVEIVNITVENVALDPQYASTLQGKALMTAETEKELKRQELIRQQYANQQLEQQQRAQTLQEQLVAEEAQTAVQVEIATREGKETAARALVYTQNEQAYELERLRLMAQIIGDKASTWFIPQGTDLTLLLNQTDQPIIPLATSAEAATP